MGDLFSARSLFFCHQGPVVPACLYLDLGAVFLRLVQLATVGEQGAHVIFGVGHVDLWAFLCDGNLIGSLDQISQSGVLLVGSRSSTLHTAAPAHPATHATPHAGDADAVPAGDDTADPHAAGTPLLVTVLNWRTECLA